jgi:hypothetical protein
LSPWAALWPAGPAAAAEYARAEEALDALDRMEADAAARLRSISAALASARPFVESALSDQERQRGERAIVRRRLGLPEVRQPEASDAEPADLAALRAAQEALVYAHAEALPALGDAWAVRILARHLVELARQLTVIDLWIEAEEQRAAEPERRRRQG